MASRIADVLALSPTNSGVTDIGRTDVRKEVYKQTGVDTAEADAGLNHLVARVQRTWPQTGMGRVAISEIESGRRKVSSLELANLARIFGREPAHFLSDEAGGRPTYASPSNLGVLARTARKLSEHDQEQLLRFAEYLRREGKRRVEKP